MSLELKQLHKSFGQEPVLKGLDLRVSVGECLAILGASGSGKSTLLKILAGLTEARHYQLYYQGTALHSLPTQERGVIYIDQEALLFPFLTVLENVAFGLKARKIAKQEREKAALALLKELELTDLRHKKPGQLSGGQKQRVAFARALILEPRVLLLDEPFAALDAPSRQKMQQLFLSSLATRQMTSLFVTHDAREALVVGSQYAYLEAGRLETFANRSAFIQDPRTGLKEEIHFWRQLEKNEKDHD